MSAPASKVRAARGFLRTKLKAGSGDVNPRHFADASHELGLPFNSVAGILARLYSGGQNESFYREQAVESAVRSGQ